MNESEYNASLDRIERKLARDYLAQAAALRNGADLSQILALIRAGDTFAASQTFNGASYSGLLEGSRNAFIEGGTDEARDLTRGAKAAVRAAGGSTEFNVRRASAAAKLQANAETTLQGILQEQAAAVEVTISAARARGETPPQIARQIVGEYSGILGQRVGGVAGLDGQAAQFVQNARTQLLSGDPEQMRAYFSRVRRDRRFDGIVQRAIDAGTPVDVADVDRMTQRYAWRLLQTRADTVATIEALENYNAGRQQMYDQMVEDGVPATDIFKRWKTRGDEKVRASHRAMNGQTVPGGGFFLTPRGYKMLNPGDMSNGAPMSEIARCRCRAIYTVKGE